MTEERGLANQLLARAGIEMEDAHAAAMLDDDQSTMAERIETVRRAGIAATVLADAAGLVWQSRASDNK